ncbi:Low molecular weight phosphotyrosine protein phosphatase [Histomonas meleagridis]|uniref:Low molecular weight phosphotyrosine protein phosphatase n=1 Tax=Histomonas meleagridis TaxID=135588 RepID=UPI00355A9C9B|nr:Low molecular weight phosphotyrosine protein phosphatase [Histomonas meleagridis]KAH0798441.1 Low molecular weight phosphotyrosine protein phosphatase [Histomonas meleagridis]
MDDKKAVLFVCLGNICRSPTCEGICRSYVGKSLHVESAATSSWHRYECPDERSQEVCLKHGIDIGNHRSRVIRNDDWSRFNVIAALDSNVLQTLEAMKPQESKAKLVLFNDPEGIADPYYGGRRGFQKMYNQISEIMKQFLLQNDLVSPGFFDNASSQVQSE